MKWLLAGLGLLACLSTAAERRSGFADMKPETQALQRDDTLNPAMLWVRGGEQAWSAREGAARSCQDCHGDVAVAMRGTAARHPAFDEASQGVLTLAGRINRCRQRHQGQPAWPPESESLLGLQALVALASRGQPIAPPADDRMASWRDRGRRLFEQRQGQLDLSCAQCHDQLAGRRLAGSVIPQGHPNGYPLYRLEWQALGSLSRRIRNCLSGIRAEVPPYGSADLTALEVFLMDRARGMALEAPAVRP